ncbi:MAG: hypothetical protein HGA40_05160 [Methanoregulaceae archaeon]|nr:hypothetical protein [Methanoregulaceae archaeon]
MNKPGTIILLAILAILITPCSAFLSLQDVQVIPPEVSLPVHTVVNATGVIQIIPQGPTTFIEGYTLVLSTDLERARWNVMVLVDGNQAAVIPKEGNFVFINGFLLSYPTNRDVVVSVQVNGTVPELQDGTPFRVMQAEELNNHGQVVGDSEEVTVRTVMNRGILPSQTPDGGMITTVVTVPVPTTTKAGISIAPVIAMVFLVLVMVRRKSG